ncbi:hypothetical protein CALVIDRAFT_481517 [Calocera viscosa TUFC12733]|uniref:Deoxycytidylate deaminase n=1 Tax=Calocera viscosa (strain TUFC12733) TaxID=1330018 RepID=A0A167M6C1_CALVF|nr:hypothetical protein CALVIDRAFT_481517 [Calocera viscosa TUFC12733]
MFIGIVGTECSGKSLVKHYLTSKGFVDLSLPNGPAHHPHSHSFPTPSAMLDHATHNWRQSYVTTSLSTKAALEPFMKRPFFLLLVVDAPLMLRWRRLRAKRPAGVGDLEAFLQRNDEFVYGPEGDGILSIPGVMHDIVRSFVHVSVVNAFESVSALHSHLDSLNLQDQERLRPSWDSYFMTLAHLASLRSNCMKRRVGALLVRSHRVISTGYNGTPRGLRNCNEGGCARCNGSARSGEALDECLCLHAEENALLEAGRERVGGGGGEGAVLYCNTCPCLRCSVKIVQTGVREVVYNLAYSMDEASARVFKEAGVALRQHCPPP